MNLSPTSRKLFFTLLLLGISNILLAYVFFYVSSTSLLEERSGQQMSSVRAMASQKLMLYLDHLKAYSIQHSDRPHHSQRFDLVAVYLLTKDQQLEKVFSKRTKTLSNFFYHMKPLIFFPLQNDEFAIKVHKEKHDVIWIYSGEGLNRILGEKEGLGHSGEIYLVGPDQRIRSTSRHLRDWRSVKVENESITQAKLNKIGVHLVKDYRGVEVLSAYAPFDYDHLNFILLSEIDKDEVLSPMRGLLPKVFLICGLFCLMTLVLAYASTSKIIALIEEMREQINKFHIKFINTIEDEKKRISYNLHDGVGQILTALKWGISQQQEPAKLKELCDDAFKEIRSISNDLMPAVLTELGCFSAVKEHVSKLEDFYRINITYRYSEQLKNFNFREGMEVNLYRMIQELLHNTLKHSQAKNISLVLLKEDDYLHLRYEDDGIGMADTDPMPRVLLYRSELMGVAIKRNKISQGLVYELQIPLMRLFHEEL